MKDAGYKPPLQMGESEEKMGESAVTGRRAGVNKRPKMINMLTYGNSGVRGQRRNKGEKW